MIRVSEQFSDIVKQVLENEFNINLDKDLSIHISSNGTKSEGFDLSNIDSKVFVTILDDKGLQNMNAFLRNFLSRTKSIVENVTKERTTFCLVLAHNINEIEFEKIESIIEEATYFDIRIYKYELIIGRYDSLKSGKMNNLLKKVVPDYFNFNHNIVVNEKVSVNSDGNEIIFDFGNIEAGILVHISKESSKSKVIGNTLALLDITYDFAKRSKKIIKYYFVFNDVLSVQFRKDLSNHFKVVDFQRVELLDINDLKEKELNMSNLERGLGIKLKSVVIEDFKSIKHLELKISELNCFVGKNEAGKSNVLEAISYLDFENRKLTADLLNVESERFGTDDFPIIKGVFELNKEGAEQLQKVFPNLKPFKSIVVSKVEINIKSNKLDEVDVVFHWNADKKSIRELGLSDVMANECVDRLFKIVIPQIELLTSDELIIDNVTIEDLKSNSSKTKSFQRLMDISGITDKSILFNPGHRSKTILKKIEKKLTQILNDNYSQDKEMKIRIESQLDTWMMGFEDLNGNFYSIKQRSVGFKYFFAFLFNRVYNQLHHSSKTVIYLLDEPGNSLHPGGARDLLSMFKDMAVNNQIIYTSHNPFLVLKGNIDNLFLFKRDREKGTIQVSKSFQKKYSLLREELGILLNDSFFVGDCNIVVEGPSDQYMLQYVIHENDEYSDLEFINIFSAETSSEIIPSVRYLQSLNLNGVVLLDSDKAGKVVKGKPKFKTLVEEKEGWDYSMINTLFEGDKILELEDLFDSIKYVEAFNKYYMEFDDLEKKNFESFKIESYDANKGVIDNLNSHYAEFASGGFSKIGVLRKFTENFPYTSNKELYVNVETVLKELRNKIAKLN